MTTPLVLENRLRARLKFKQLQLLVMVAEHNNILRAAQVLKRTEGRAGAAHAPWNAVRRPACRTDPKICWIAAQEACRDMDLAPDVRSIPGHGASRDHLAVAAACCLCGRAA